MPAEQTTNDSFLHLETHAMQPVLNLPSFAEYGWEVHDTGNVLVKWMTIAPAPDLPFEFFNGKCQKDCDIKRCSCVKAELNCSDLCECLG